MSMSVKGAKPITEWLQNRSPPVTRFNVRNTNNHTDGRSRKGGSLWLCWTGSSYVEQGHKIREGNETGTRSFDSGDTMLPEWRAAGGICRESFITVKGESTEACSAIVVVSFDGSITIDTFILLSTEGAESAGGVGKASKSAVNSGGGFSTSCLCKSLSSFCFGGGDGSSWLRPFWLQQINDSTGFSRFLIWLVWSTSTIHQYELGFEALEAAWCIFYIACKK